MKNQLTEVRESKLERILEWLNDDLLNENEQDKSSIIPCLLNQNILEQYVPPDIVGAGQFFTPQDMGKAAFKHLQLTPSKSLRILEPCAGIGHLLSLFEPMYDSVTIDAYEIEEECVHIGKKLFPWVNWNHKIPFYDLTNIEGKYDLVVTNPPFNTERGMTLGKGMCEGRCHRSVHIFLELAIRALKPQGKVMILAPAEFLDELSVDMQAWLEKRAKLTLNLGPLPGKFNFTSKQVHAYYFTRIGKS